MNFREEQRQTRLNTRRLIRLLKVGVYVCAFVLWYLLLLLYSDPIFHPFNFFIYPLHAFLVQPLSAVMITLALLAMVICIGTIDENKKEIILAWNTNRYATEAEMLGARTIMPSITTEKRLLNVVEEIALASGISPPNVYILDDDAAINALTVGDVPQKTAIVITSGALRYLNRDELQAVIAHEFSHISSDDIKLSILASSLIILSSLIALFSGALYGFHHFLIPMPFSIFGLTILILTSKSKDVANKQRVFGADASSMHFCGHNGIAGALKKIGGLNSIVKARYASKFSYYFFAEGAESILSTHPSLAERIKRIDPNWNGEFITPKALIDEDDTIANDDDHNKAATVAAVAIVAIQNALSNATDPLTCAKADIAAIPEYLRDQAANPLTARWVIYALLVDRRDQNIAVKQREIIAANVYLEGSKKIESAIDSFKREGIVHLIFLCMSALKKLTKKQYAHFREVADLLIEEDGKVSLFEFNLKYLVFYPLDIAFDLRKPPKIVYNAIEPIAKEISIALSAIVYDQYQNDEKAKSAFDNVCKSNAVLEYAPSNKILTQTLERAYDRIQQANDEIKQQIINLAIESVKSDGAISPEEAETIHALRSALGLGYM